MSGTAVRRVTAAAIAALLALGGALAVAAPAQAHNYLVESTPRAGEVLTELPAQFSITTNDALLNIGGNGAGFALQVRDQDGLYYGDGCIDVEGTEMSTRAALGAPGSYEVIWQVISTDGHTVSDDFSFTWQPSSDTAERSVGSKTPPDCNGELKPNSSEEATAAPTPPAPAAAADGEDVSALLWIGGAVLAVGLAIAVTLMVTSRKKPQA